MGQAQLDLGKKNKEGIRPNPTQRTRPIGVCGLTCLGQFRQVLGLTREKKRKGMHERVGGVKPKFRDALWACDEVAS